MSPSGRTSKLQVQFGCSKILLVFKPGETNVAQSSQLVRPDPAARIQTHPVTLIWPGRGRYNSEQWYNSDLVNIAVNLRHPLCDLQLGVHLSSYISSPSGLARGQICYFYLFIYLSGDTASFLSRLPDIFPLHSGLAALLCNQL